MFLFNPCRPCCGEDLPQCHVDDFLVLVTLSPPHQNYLYGGNFAVNFEIELNGHVFNNADYAYPGETPWMYAGLCPNERVYLRNVPGRWYTGNYILVTKSDMIGFRIPQVVSDLPTPPWGVVGYIDYYGPDVDPSDFGNWWPPGYYVPNETIGRDVFNLPNQTSRINNRIRVTTNILQQLRPDFSACDESYIPVDLPSNLSFSVNIHVIGVSHREQYQWRDFLFPCANYFNWIHNVTSENTTFERNFDMFWPPIIDEVSPEPRMMDMNKVVNFSKAVVKHAADGFREVDDKTQQYRLSICGQCEHLDTKRDCNLCGCPVDRKTKWASEQCPVGLWPVHDPTPPADQPPDGFISNGNGPCCP